MARMVSKYKWPYWLALYTCRAMVRLRVISLNTGARFVSRFTYLERDK
jgi:hypothetical protein